MTAPSTVRKKNVYSPSPLNVTSARKFPNRMKSVDKIVERIMALIGESDLGGDEAEDSDEGCLPTRPSTAKKGGSHFEFAAETAIRPATNEFPSREPATTRQMRMAATMPKPWPRRREMAVTATLSVAETTFHGRRM